MNPEMNLNVNLKGLKALTLHQPWAYCVACKGKPVENRTWDPPKKLIGRQFAIHAGKYIDEYAMNKLHQAGVLGNEDMREIKAQCGHIVSICTLGGIARSAAVFPEELRFWYVGPVGWMLQNTISLPEPVFHKGAQGLWLVRDRAVQQIQGQIDSLKLMAQDLRDYEESDCSRECGDDCDCCDGERCPACCPSVYSPGTEECDFCSFSDECGQ